MFDIQTEAYLRRGRPGGDSPGLAPIVPAAMVASLILWTTVLFSVV